MRPAETPIPKVQSVHVNLVPRDARRQHDSIEPRELSLR